LDARPGGVFKGISIRPSTSAQEVFTAVAKQTLLEVTDRAERPMVLAVADA